MYIRCLGTCFRLDSNQQGYSPADFESAVYSNSTTGAYQASSFVRTRLLRGLPDADYIQRRRAGKGFTPYLVSYTLTYAFLHHTR